MEYHNLELVVKTMFRNEHKYSDDVKYLGIALTGEGVCSKNWIHRSSRGTDWCVKTRLHSVIATSTGSDR